VNQRPPLHVDDNALAGPLAQVFALDPTTAWRRCPTCRMPSTAAEPHVYGPGPGMTARCPGCARIALGVVARPGQPWSQLGSDQGAFRFDLPAITPPGPEVRP